MKVAMVVLADDETHEGLGRVVNELVATKELIEGGDEVTLIFDRGGTVWPGILSASDHPAHPLWEAVHQAAAAACSYCASAFEAPGDVETAEVKLLDQYEGHPSFRTLLHDGYRIITF